ncbi:hypothetical protein VF21_01964 [Pseudogymnoascus sp. 05NY08]|nr:hypothetical protein VF21_01964 [Pseudogymnoascus sp. 05NY08]
MASRTDQFKAAKQEMQRAFAKAEEEENRKIKETDEAKEPSPWLRRVRCITYLAGVDQKEQSTMQTVRDKIRAFQEWKEEQEKSAEGEDRDEDEGFNDGEDDEGVEGVKGAAEEVDEGFEDEVSKETKWMQQIQREVLRFCITLLDHPLQDSEYQSPIISSLAVLMIKGDKGWHDAEDFTTKYSAVIKLAQLMVVQEAYKQRQEQIRTYQSEMTEVEARRKATSYYWLVKQFVAQFTTIAHGGRDPTPMQWIYQTRSYGFKIRYTTPAAGKIQWIRDEVLYPSTCVQMSQLQSIVHGLIREARDELFGKLMVVTDKGGVPSINWDNTVDQPLETKVGWSFLDDERNKFSTHKEWWLFERLYQEQALQEQFLDNDGLLKPSASEAYQRHVEWFLELLLILIHLCAGQPSCATEILGLQWKNTANGGVRNVIIENGLVGLVGQYHKGYRSSGNIKIIHQYLP